MNEPEEEDGQNDRHRHGQVVRLLGEPRLAPGDVDESEQMGADARVPARVARRDGRAHHNRDRPCAGKPSRLGNGRTQEKNGKDHADQRHFELGELGEVVAANDGAPKQSVRIWRIEPRRNVRRRNGKHGRQHAGAGNEQSTDEHSGRDMYASVRSERVQAEHHDRQGEKNLTRLEALDPNTVPADTEKAQREEKCPAPS